MRLSEKQKALLADCADDYMEIGNGVLLSGHFAEHSLRTAKSLEQYSWLTIGESGSGDKVAYFVANQYADWREMTGVANDD